MAFLHIFQAKATDIFKDIYVTALEARELFSGGQRAGPDQHKREYIPSSERIANATLLKLRGS